MCSQQNFVKLIVSIIFMKNMNHFGSIIYQNPFFLFLESLNAQINFLGGYLYSIVQYLFNSYSHAQFQVWRRKLWSFEISPIIFQFVFRLSATLHCKYAILHLLHWNFHMISIGFLHKHIMDIFYKFHLIMGSMLLVTAYWSSRPISVFGLECYRYLLCHIEHF